jgi:hypothetical protein
MHDFEVHQRGTLQGYLEEIRLSRALARAIEHTYGEYQYPQEVIEAIADLQALYVKQIERGDM